MSSTSDTVPGTGGVSLREAIQAAHSSPGPSSITFASGLAGRTIVLGSGFSITRDGIAIEGLLDAAGRAAITLDVTAVSPIVFGVSSSDFSLRKLRFVRMVDTFAVAMNLSSGREAHDIAIEQNEFDNSAVAASTSIPVTIGTAADAVAARISRVTISGNRFIHVRAPPGAYGGDGIHIHADGQDSVLQDIVIRGNTFLDLDYPVELVSAHGRGNRIVGVQIIANEFAGNAQAINLNHISSGSLVANSIENTLIASNTFRENRSDIVLYGGLFPGANGNSIVNTHVVSNTFTNTLEGFSIHAGGGSAGANDNRIQSLRIANNVFRNIAAFQAIFLNGGVGNSSDNVVENAQILNNLIAGSSNFAINLTGGFDTSSRNRVRGLRITNNTIVNAGGHGVSSNPNVTPAAGNEISDVVVANTILWGNANDLSGFLPAQVVASLTQSPAFAGTNGNVGGDPRFADPASGDFHLREGSPAIASGDPSRAPYEDLECRSRGRRSDMGAYAFGVSGLDCNVAQRNFTTLWWDPSEPGWGINLSHQGSALFATLFTYASDGKPLWLVASNLAQAPDGSYAGPVYRTTGPAFNQSPWSSITLTSVGTMTVRAATASALALTYSFAGSNVSKILQKQAFASPLPSCVAITGSRSSATNFQDLWWNPSEPGWGLNLTHQGDQIFATLFTYDSTGRDLWLVASAMARQADGSFSGALYSTQGPRFDARPWSAISVAPVGSMRLRFSSGESGSLEYDYGGVSVSKSVVRQVFAASAPSCQL